MISILDLEIFKAFTNSIQDFRILSNQSSIDKPDKSYLILTDPSALFTKHL